jgi:hypothetical protein
VASYNRQALAEAVFYQPAATRGEQAVEVALLVLSCKTQVGKVEWRMELRELQKSHCSLQNMGCDRLNATCSNIAANTCPVYP